MARDILEGLKGGQEVKGAHGDRDVEREVRPSVAGSASGASRLPVGAEAANPGLGKSGQYVRGSRQRHGERRWSIQDAVGEVQETLAKRFAK